MLPRKLVCGECGHVHNFPTGFANHAHKIVSACDGCGARITIEPRKFFGWSWPKITTRKRQDG